MKKKHGNTGNKNAAGEIEKDARITLRCNSEVKSAFVKQAQREGMKLSEWILSTLQPHVDSDLIWSKSNEKY